MTFILTLSLLLSQAPSTRQADHRWHSAAYRGLSVGKSRRAEMLRLFGRPRWSRTTPGDDEPESHGVTWNNYERIGEFRGITNIANDSRTGIITRIDFYPEKLSKEQAIAHFGRGYIISRYDFDRCGGDEESEPIYESPNGPLFSVEYRERGIASSLGYKDLVTKISYVSGPIGSARPKCK